MISKEYAASVAFANMCACEHVRDSCAGVSYRFSDFYMSELEFQVRVQCVGVLSIGYCLSNDIITKGQRQTGRQVWQAAVGKLSMCVRASTFLCKMFFLNKEGVNKE